VRLTKIVATLGPKTFAPSMIDELIEAGANIFRLNFSHVNYETFEQIIAYIKKINQNRPFPIGLLGDLQGPKLRVGELKNSFNLKDGDIVQLKLSTESQDCSYIPIPHPEIFSALSEENRILINDGRFALKVLNTNKSDTISAEVIHGGYLTSRKGINIPDCVLDLPVLTPKDQQDLDFALKHELDWIALSFVQLPSDVETLRSQIGCRPTKVMVKIEKPSAIRELEDIVKAADGVMVARGDLGVEMPYTEIPRLQQKIIRTCQIYGKPVVVATQMLESMIEHPSPTRAEVSDVSLAINQSTDATMLSAESASGSYPAKTVATMAQIITTSEQHLPFNQEVKPFCLTNSIEEDLFYTTSILSRSPEIAAIVAFTRSGYTTFKMAGYRPCKPIIALTPSKIISQQLSLVYGCYAMCIPELTNFNDMIEYAQNVVLDHGFDPQKSFLMLAGYPAGHLNLTNTLHLVKPKT